MGTVKPLWMRAFGVKWYGVSEQQSTALGAFVLIPIFFPLVIPYKLPTSSSLSALEKMFKKSSKLSQPHMPAQAFNFLHWDKSRTSPSLVPVISEWAVIYFTGPFGHRSSFSLIHFPAPPLCPGDQCRLPCRPHGGWKADCRCPSGCFHYLAAHTLRLSPKIFCMRRWKNIELCRVCVLGLLCYVRA